MSAARIRSGADGVYELCYFGSHVRHTLRTSRDTYGLLAGKLLSENAPDWKSASEDQRAAYLLEEHENAHHSLLYSCPAGVLYWRLLQVVHRDIAHFSQANSRLKVDIPQNQTPLDFFRSGEFFERLIEMGGGQKSDFSYPQGIIDAIDKIFCLIDILFHHSPKTVYADLNIGDLLDLLNDVFQWLSERCAIPPAGLWVSELPKTEKVFLPGRDFNCMGLTEVHAVAHELYLLRALGDIDRFRERESEFIKDIFGSCFEIVKRSVPFDNEVGYSPHHMQLVALFALSGRVDPALSSGKPIVLEKEFPNFRVPRALSESVDLITGSAENLNILSQTPLIGSGSNWLHFHARSDSMSIDSAQDFFSTLLSIGLDRQIYSIKHGAATNAQYIASAGLHSFGKLSAERFNQEWEKWNRDLKLSQLLCEYSDDFYFWIADPDQIYPENSPIRQIKGIEMYFHPSFQFFSSLLTGFVVQMNIASYFHYPVVEISVVEQKIRRYFERETAEFSADSPPDEIIKLVNGTLRRYYETDQAPFGIHHIRLSPGLTHLI